MSTHHPSSHPSSHPASHPSGDPAAQLLRSRARSLRTLADRIERSAAMRLDQHAGPETWHSPRADLCRWVLGINRSQLQRSVDELRVHAHQLDRQAAEIDAAIAAARIAAATAGAPMGTAAIAAVGIGAGR